jgi:glycosyltransferase involved in cell wall biosynthesis
MCKPEVMVNFINWYNNTCKPIAFNNPYMFEDAKYDGKLSSDKLIKMWGQPYYPHYPFVIERLNHIFFTNNYKIVFLISHTSTHHMQTENTGAPNVLNILHNFYKKHGVKVVFHYLNEVDNIDIVEYIETQSYWLNCSPVVICNTLVCGDIVQKLAKSNIKIYWYIHEWYEHNGFNSPFEKYLHLFNSDINIIFICKSQYEYYLKHTPIKNYIIIKNGINNDILSRKMNEIPEKTINIQQDDFIISIIGTVDDRKNQQKFIDDVFYKCKNKHPKIKLLLIGSIDKFMHIQPEYSDAIIQIGNVNNAIPYIKLSDIVVSYSLNEVFPLNIMESFFCKTCVISSNVGGVNELICDNYNGFLFEKNDSIDCFDKLCKLIEQEDLRIKFAENAKTEIEKYDDKITFKDFLFLLGVQ